MAHNQEIIPFTDPGPDDDSWSQRVRDSFGGAGTGPDQQPEQVPGEDEQVRFWTTDRLRNLIRNLQPYVDGTFGTVSTKHVQVYLSAIRELNKLWSAYFVIPPPPPPPEPSIEEEEVREAELARITRARVLDQLEELRSRSRS